MRLSTAQVALALSVALGQVDASLFNRLDDTTGAELRPEPRAVSASSTLQTTSSAPVSSMKKGQQLAATPSTSTVSTSTKQSLKPTAKPPIVVAQYAEASHLPQQVAKYLADVGLPGLLSYKSDLPPIVDNVAIPKSSSTSTSRSASTSSTRTSAIATCSHTSSCSCAPSATSAATRTISSTSRASPTSSSTRSTSSSSSKKQTSSSSSTKKSSSSTTSKTTSTSTSKSTTSSSRPTGAYADLPTPFSGKTIVATVSGVPITTPMLVPMLPVKAVYTIGFNRIASTSTRSSVAPKIKTASVDDDSGTGSDSGSGSNSGSGSGSGSGSDAFPAVGVSSTTSASSAKLTSSTSSATSSSSTSLATTTTKANSGTSTSKATSSTSTSKAISVKSTATTTSTTRSTVSTGSQATSTSKVQTTSSTSASSAHSSASDTTISATSKVLPSSSLTSVTVAATSAKRDGFGIQLFRRAPHVGLLARKRDATLSPDVAVASALLVAGIGGDDGPDGQGVAPTNVQQTQSTTTLDIAASSTPVLDPAIVTLSTVASSMASLGDSALTSSNTSAYSTALETQSATPAQTEAVQSSSSLAPEELAVSTSQNRPSSSELIGTEATATIGISTPSMEAFSATNSSPGSMASTVGSASSTSSALGIATASATPAPLMVKPKDPAAFRTTSALLSSRLQLQADAQAQAQATVSLLAQAQASAKALIDQLDEAGTLAMNDLQSHGSAAAMAKATATALAAEQMAAKAQADKLWHAQQLAEIQLFAESQKLNEEVTDAQAELLILAEDGNTLGDLDDTGLTITLPKSSVVLSLVTATNESMSHPSVVKDTDKAMHDIHIGTTVLPQSKIDDGADSDVYVGNVSPNAHGPVGQGPISSVQMAARQVAPSGSFSIDDRPNPDDAAWYLGFEHGYALAKGDSGGAEVQPAPPIGITILNQPAFVPGLQGSSGSLTGTTSSASKHSAAPTPFAAAESTVTSSTTSTSAASFETSAPGRLRAPLRTWAMPSTFHSLDDFGPIVKFSSGRENLKVFEYGLPSEAFEPVQVPDKVLTKNVTSSTIAPLASTTTNAWVTASTSSATTVPVAKVSPSTSPLGTSSAIPQALNTTLATTTKSAETSTTTVATMLFNASSSSASVSAALSSVASTALASTSTAMAISNETSSNNNNSDTVAPLRLYRASAAKYVPAAELQAAEAEFMAEPGHDKGEGGPSVEARAMRSVMEVLYPAGSVNPAGSVVGGAQFYALTALGDANATASMTTTAGLSVPTASTSTPTASGTSFKPLLGFLNALLPASRPSSDTAATVPSFPSGTDALASLGTAKKVTFRYSVWFPPNFQFVKGGKLPGLYGGSESCSGGNSAAECWSSRMMWRENGVGEMYLYAPQQVQDPGLCEVPPKSVCDANYGISVGRGSFKFRTGSWTRVEQTLTMSSAPNATDGALSVVVDGQPRFHFDKVAFPASVRGIFFSTFFGGHTPDWATPVDQKAWFRDFALSIDA